MKLLLIFIGGGVGSVLRYGIAHLFSVKTAFHPLLATLSVNTVGSFCLGALVAYFARQNGQNENIALALTVGLCGGFTTFSTFSLEIINLLKTGDFIQASIYISSSILLSLFLLFLGWKLMA
jgi:CrcB protein|tara:strand:+ start:32812 stop:33177 length:366 start_codon:yes stop_codon:yes gene_type:complete